MDTTIQNLQMEVANILNRITDPREWVKATSTLKAMIDLTSDPADHPFVYQIWIESYSGLYPA
jgi:hypothetical protein